MRKNVTSFRFIVGRIMFIGSSAVAPSTNLGFYYTSGGRNDIWAVMDEAVKRKTGENPGFVKLIEEYKAIGEQLSEQELSTIADLLSQDKFLADADDSSETPRLQRMAAIQRIILARMERYGFGFADAISGCSMTGTSDQSRKDGKYNKDLADLLRDVDVVVINGAKTNKNKKGAYRSFKIALGIDGVRHNAEYDELKKKHHIIDDLPSTSGQAGRTKEHPNLNRKTKIDKWVDAIQDFIKIK